MTHQKPTSNQIHEFEEERARLMLLYAFPEKYESAVLSESPDIAVYSNSIGVEVTDATDQDLKEKLSYVTSISRGRIDPNSDRYKKRNNDDIVLRTLPNGKRIAAFSKWGDMCVLLSAYKKKINKLNQNHYTIFNENNLFIAAWLIDDDELNDGLMNIYNFNTTYKSEYKRWFRNMYIWGNGKLYAVDLDSHDCTVRSISNDSMSEISKTAFIVATGISIEEYYQKETSVL